MKAKPCYYEPCENENGEIEGLWCSEEHKTLYQKTYGVKLKEPPSEIRGIIEKLKAKEITLKQIMSRDLFFIIKHYWFSENFVAMKACINEARSRLEAKGLTYIEGEGWK